MGTRLAELTRNLPKVMVPIAGKPVLEHHLEWLKGFGVPEFYLNLHYLADVISDYFEDGSRWVSRSATTTKSAFSALPGPFRFSALS